MSAIPAEIAEGLLQAMSEALYVVDQDRRITYWNRAAEEVTGFPAEEVMGRSCRDGILNHVDEEGASLCGTRCPLLGTMRDGQVRDMVAYAHHRDGHRLPVAVKAAPLRDSTGRIYGAVEVFHDDSRCASLAQQAADAREESLTDPLTGLVNRRMLERTLRHLQDEQTRYTRRFAVLFADIDRFKLVNDRYGHPAGDAALRSVARTLRGCIRPSDVVGRWGGEEFLLLAQVPSPADGLTLAERMRKLVASSWIEVDGEKVTLSLSVGVALSHPSEPAALTVARADSAMLAAKAEGRNRTVVSIADESDQEASRDRLSSST